ncbi:3-hydroxyacyl-CoA dehydrogenase [Ammoniphilus sp. CFH 90114]|uniref:3-hydroxyacyl-CoA dehydrogenase n=1 Tax=Ammoniphilus sp. CFH 90114 TaxID=2493665 RepID=UPI00100E434D|nr:3-hydroxyacyl-CoA dehydrogenase [Ammoniphilus sp. CFH 90114]RXT06586.1 3-hydroxyacyl-CoA dehydrogenase [Ammoniphilus sp. CFH 90114]
MPIEKILVVGSGIMGRGIAYVAAVGGYQVAIQDVSLEALENAKKEIGITFDTGITKGKISKEEAEQSFSRITFIVDPGTVAADTDLVIEAVPEVMSIKKSVFEKMDQIMPERTLLATNTSTMSPTEIGSYTNRPDKVIAMHFFNPVPKMKLVEIIRGLETSDETAQAIEKVAGKMGKESVMINEFPGFVTSRISSLVGNEAFHMLMEGVGTAEEIDRAIELGLNYPMGPFKLGDLVGLDTRLKNLEYMHQTLGERFRPSPLLVKYVKAGRLGRKTGKGVYDYNQS